MCLPLAAVTILAMAKAVASGMAGKLRMDGVLWITAKGWSLRAHARVLSK